ncbi:MAG: FixH family protein [Rhizobiaceae bacterium]|nr:FixH family protein [Rhizobiaceae bacterium]
MSTRRSREFTGRHMLVITLAFFGVIIAVNLVMATLARTSWTGLVVENSYVASQQFNEKARQGRAQDALGWSGKLTLDKGFVRYTLEDSDARPIDAKSATAHFRHPAYDRKDVTLVLEAVSRGDFRSSETVPDGVWIAELDVDAGGERPYRQVQRVVVSGGTIR